MQISRNATAAAAVVAAGFAGAAIAGAASSNSSGSSSASSTADGTPIQAQSQSQTPTESRPKGAGEVPLSAADEAKVKAAALAKYPGATILRIETDAQHGSPFEAHVQKADGTEVEVLVNKSFEVTDSIDHGAGGPGGGHHGRGGPGGRGGDETALTGDTAAKVTAAAKAKVPGGTVQRVETDAQHGSPYEAHVTKSDGSEVEVLVNKSFEVTAVNDMPKHP